MLKSVFGVKDSFLHTVVPEGAVVPLTNQASGISELDQSKTTIGEEEESPAHVVEQSVLKKTAKAMLQEYSSVGVFI